MLDLKKKKSSREVVNYFKITYGYFLHTGLGLRCW